MEKTLPFTKEQMLKIIETNPTPFHIYDEKTMGENARKFQKAFGQLPGFKEYFAVKANPNPHIIKILHKEGFGVDCSSLTELIIAEKLEITGDEIMFSSNDTPSEEFKKAKELGAIINLDDITHIESLEKSAGIPKTICFRYNPGPLRKGNSIIGKPEEAKYGMTREQILKACKTMHSKGVKKIGLHTMVISNELNESYFVETAKMMFELALEVNKKLKIKIDFVNLGGGIGIPYRPDQKGVSYQNIAKGIKLHYEKIIVKNNLHPLKIFMECGRVIAGPYGFLVTKAIHIKDTYKKYIGTDASMANLMRPGMYGAYHHITVLGKENEKPANTYDVTGSLCENNDKFAIDRKLPKIEIEDILIIHDAGAHGFSMGFNYNGKLRSSELLLKPNGTAVQIRRAETVDDYFATINFGEQ